MQTLLTCTNISIEHFYSNSDSSAVPNFSKYIIKSVVAKNIGFRTHKAVTIRVGNEIHSFNYWDYVSAFYNTFLIDNARSKHTWLIKLCTVAL